MNAAETCHLLVEQTKTLSRVRRERDTWRLITQQAINYAHDLHVELDRLRRQYRGLLDERRQRREKAA